MKKVLILLLFVSAKAIGQKIPSFGFDKVRIADSNKTVQAELKPVASDPDMEPDRFYYWYSGNKIHSTQGGFSGRLLNGRYNEYYPNKNLKEIGSFKKGLKEGMWESWKANGIITQRYTWGNGLKSGIFNIYDDQGNLKQSGTYRRDLLEGPVKNYNDGHVITVVHYREGKIVAEKTSLSFWKRINLFKKKNKSSSRKPGNAINQIKN